ncbi:MAG: helix-turn-helix transcriptional regulator [Acetatifactor sp.]|nr:helix-turn-helix transcriptional regulator [Acetatifactor sp.]
MSGRELEVLKLLLGGLSNGEISAQLFISESTVKFHIRNLLKKTECTNRMALIALVKR